MASRLLKVEAEQRRRQPGWGPARWGRQLADRIRQALANLDRFTAGPFLESDHRRLVLAVAAGAFVLSLIALPFLGRELFPRTDAGMLTATISLPLGSTIEQTGQIAEQVEEILAQVPEVDTIFTSVGGSELFSAGGMGTYAEHATIDVNLKPQRERKRSDLQLAEVVREQVQDTGPKLL